MADELGEITLKEIGLLRMLREEPELVENLRKCTATEPHQRSMLERLRVALIRAAGSQRKTTPGGFDAVLKILRRKIGDGTLDQRTLTHDDLNILREFVGLGALCNCCQPPALRSTHEHP
jgi:hypothetical protein